MNPADGPSRGSLFPSKPVAVPKHGAASPGSYAKQVLREDQEETEDCHEGGLSELTTGGQDQGREEQGAKRTATRDRKLCEAAVGPIRYNECWRQFLKMSNMKANRKVSAERIDAGLTSVLDQMWLEGESLSSAQYMLAAVLFKLPQLSSPKMMTLPLSRQTLQAGESWIPQCLGCPSRERWCV